MAARIAVQGTERMIDVAEADGEAYLGIASLGFDSDANRIANESRVIRGNMVYLYSALRALASWKCASFTVTVDGERHELRGYSVAVANSQAYGGGMYIAPQAELDDGLLDVVAIGEVSRLRFLANLPKVFQRQPPGRAQRVHPPRRGDHGRGRAPLPRLRRRRPDRRRARDHDRGPALPARGRPRVSPSLTRGAARTVRSLSRRLGRGGGTTLPGRLLLRADPDAHAATWPPSWTTARC